MKPEKIRGLVLREYEAGESDKRLVILAKDKGRRLVYARGARKATSKYMHGAQSFTYADFVINKGNGFYTLSQVEIIENFYPLREDYDRLMAAYAITQACDQTLWDDIESNDLLRLALYGLHYLAKGEILPDQVLSVFLIRFFDVFGFRPDMESCQVCGAGVGSIARAAICKEGLVCYHHKPLEYAPAGPATLAAMAHILDVDGRSSFLFNAGENVLGELRGIREMLWAVNFEG